MKVNLYHRVSSRGRLSQLNLHCNVGEKRRTFPMARPKDLMGNFTNLYRIYKTHQTNVLTNHESYSPTFSTLTFAVNIFINFY